MTAGSSQVPDDRPARMSHFSVFGIYDSDLESPTLCQIWSDRALADMVVQIWNAYEATNPYPDPCAELTDEQSAALLEWANRHPCGRSFGVTAPFRVVEMPVFGSMPRLVSAAHAP